MGILQARKLERLPCPPPEDLPNPGMEPRSAALQADSLSSEPPGKPKNTGVGNPSLLQGNFPTQESNRGLLRCRQILYQLSYQARLRQIVLTRGSQMAAHSIITWGTFKYSDAEIIIKTGETQKYIFKVPWMWTSIIHITWVLVRNEESSEPPQTYIIRNLPLPRCPNACLGEATHCFSNWAAHWDDMCCGALKIMDCWFLLPGTGF